MNRLLFVGAIFLAVLSQVTFCMPPKKNSKTQLEPIAKVDESVQQESQTTRRRKVSEWVLLNGKKSRAMMSDEEVQKFFESEFRGMDAAQRLQHMKSKLPAWSKREIEEFLDTKFKVPVAERGEGSKPQGISDEQRQKVMNNLPLDLTLPKDLTLPLDLTLPKEPGRRT